MLSWARLVTGSVASLDANVAVAAPSLTGRVIAASALYASWELLTVRCFSAPTGDSPASHKIGDGQGGLQT